VQKCSRWTFEIDQHRAASDPRSIRRVVYESDVITQSEHHVLGHCQTSNDAILFGDNSATQRRICGHDRVSRHVAGADVFFERTFYILLDFGREF